MKKLIMLVLLIFIMISLKAQITTYNLIFSDGQTELVETQKKSLDSLARQLSNGERVMIFPLTYDYAYDQYAYAKTAKTQANKIAEYAKTKGFELLGIPANFPSAFRGLSVSVDLKYNKPEDEISAELISAPAPGTLKGHYPPKPSQYFVIDPAKDTIVTGNEGTKLVFAAGCLQSPDKVKIELKEFYTMADYLKDGLPTVSNGKMLSSGGVIYLNAVNNKSNKQVSINPQKGVGVEFTNGKDDPEMQVFVKDPRSPEKMNWVLQPTYEVVEDWQMTETFLDASGKIVSQKTYYSKEEWEKHLKEVKQQEEEKKKAADIKQKTQNEMNRLLTVNKLGYINCDKFYNEPVIPFIVKADKNMSAEYYLVYQDVRGVMNGSESNKQVSFGSVPANRQAVLIAATFVDNQAYFFKTNISAGSKVIPEVILKPVDESFLNQQLQMLK